MLQCVTRRERVKQRTLLVVKRDREQIIVRIMNINLDYIKRVNMGIKLKLNFKLNEFLLESRLAILFETII